MARGVRGRRRADAAEGERRPSGTARDRALALLAVRWRSEAELRRRLRMAGFPHDEIEEALQGLERTGLIDDARFAREVVRDQAGRRKASARAMRSVLREKGVDSLLAEEVLAEAGGDEERAMALAQSRAHRLSGLPPDAAYRRLYGLLLRRGYGPSIARDACRAALAGVIEGDAESGLQEP